MGPNFPILSTLLILCFAFGCINASCSKPATPANAYPLTESAQAYTTDAKYELFCKPGYTLSGDTELVCLASGAWSNKGPTCSPPGWVVPWWLAFIVIVCVTIFVPCTVPRVIFCLCHKEKDRKKTQNGKINKGFKDEESGNNLWNEKPPLTENPVGGMLYGKKR